MVDINLCVIGGSDVVRAGFIQQAFDLSAPDSFPPTSRNYMIDGKIHVVWIYEISLNDLELTKGGEHLIWPHKKDDVPLPPFHSVIILYSLMDHEIHPTLSRILGEFLLHFEPCLLILPPSFAPQ